MQLKTKAIIFSSNAKNRSMSKKRFVVPKKEYNIKKDLSGFVSHNGSLLFLFALLLAGMVFGALSARYADSSMLHKMDFLFMSNFETRAAQSLSSTFAAALASSFLFFLLLIMMGLSLWGGVAVPAVPFFKGFGAGFSAGYFYAFYGWKGILFNLIVMLPGVFLSSSAIVLSAREAIRCSSTLVSTGLPGKNHEKQYPSLKIYFFRNGVVLIILVLAALLDMICTALFAAFFSF